MVKAIIFDCFGVILVDALELFVQEKEKDDPKIRPFMHDLMVQNNRGLITPAESNRQIAEYLGMTVEEFRHSIESKEGKNHDLLLYVKALRETYKTAMLSNIGAASLNHRFDQGELDEHFDAVVTSAELGIAKPDEQIYRHTAELLGVEPEECVFVDDREEYCQGAKQAGMKAILFTNLKDLQTVLPKLIV